MNILNFEFDFTGFDYSRYVEGERAILNPQLRKAGYEIDGWVTTDGDSFGPLVRGTNVTKDGQTFFVSYG